MAGAEVNLLAFNATPTGPEHTQLTLFPENLEQFVSAAERLGALAELHQKLFDASINVYASTGVSDGAGHFGYVLYVRGQDYDAAERALGI